MMLPIFAAERALLLAERPGDETRLFGPLIRALCRAGRPPFVVVLTDGPAPNPAADRQVREALAGLGLEAGRMLRFGIAGAAPEAGPVFEAAVAALGFVSWRHDCNVIAAPPALRGLADAVVGRTGVGQVEAGGGSLRVLQAPRQTARDALSTDSQVRPCIT